MSSATPLPAPPTLTSLSAPYMPGAKWHLSRDDSISFPPARSGRGVKGPRSLASMCLRVLADNIAGADAAMLGELPSGLQRALWNELAPRTMPLSIWSTISRVLLADCSARAGATPPPRHQQPPTPLPLSALRYTQSLPPPPLPLPIYLTPLASLPPSTLIHLRIDNVAQTDTRALVEMPALLPQLAVLELVEPEPEATTSEGGGGGGARINDRLVRAWLRQGGFAGLRVLRLLSRGPGLGEGAVREVLGALGGLVVLDVTAEVGGWGMGRVEDLKVGEGWRVHEAKARSSPFTEYVEGCFEGKVVVQSGVVGALQKVFEDDRRQVEVVQTSREVIHEGREETKATGAKDLPKGDWKVGSGFKYRDRHSQRPPPDSDPTSYLDDAWRELLEGRYPLFQPTSADTEAWIRPQHHIEASDNDRTELSNDDHQNELLDNDDGQEKSIDEAERDALYGNRFNNQPELSGFYDSDEAPDNYGTRAAELSLNNQAAAAAQPGTWAEPFNHHTELSDDQAFWFLALLDQREYNHPSPPTRPATRGEVAGIALPRSQFVSLKLCGSSSLAHRRRQVLNSPRLIFTRWRVQDESAPAGEEEQAAAVPLPKEHVQRLQPRPPPQDAAPSWAPRADDRRTANLKPRKKQKLADVFSGFGM